MKKLIIISLIVGLASASIVNADMDLRKKLNDSKKAVNDGLSTAQEAAQRILNPTIGIVESAIIETVQETPEYKAYSQDPTHLNRLTLEVRTLVVATGLAIQYCGPRITDESPFVKRNKGCGQAYKGARRILTTR